MDLRKFFSKNLVTGSSNIEEEANPSTSMACATESCEDGFDKTDESLQPHKKKPRLTPCEKKKVYKSQLSYKPEWQKKYPWVFCTDPKEGMFCRTCQKWGAPPAGSRGGWTERGIMDWNHATDMLKKHANSQWHKDASATAAMAQKTASGMSVLDMQCSIAARELADRKERNRLVLLQLLRAVYFLVKHRIPHTTVYPDLIELLVANGDKILGQHLNECPGNARYTSKFTVNKLVEAIDTWLENRLVQSLKSSPYFSILADESQDIASQEELSICCRWLVDGCPEEHFLTVLHIKATNAEAITAAITSFIDDKKLEYSRLVGQGYDGAAAFSGVQTGVQRRIRTKAAHALYIHCSCHQLQLASIQAAQSVGVLNRMFGTMTNLWNLFHYSPKKAEMLKHVQAVLNLPELKVTKPSDTRWLSHERCLRAILKELPALIITLHSLYDDSGDAEAYGIALALGSFSGVASLVLLSTVLDLLAKLNCFMQRKATDFSRLPIVLESIVSELKGLKQDGADWCSQVEATTTDLANKHSITLCTSLTRSGAANFTNLSDFKKYVAHPYIDHLVSNIEARFSDAAVKLLVSSSVFNPGSFPTDETALADYGKESLQILLDFYGEEVEIEFNGSTYSSPPLVDKNEVLSEWKLFKRALVKEKRDMVEKRKLSKPPSLQEVKKEMESYAEIFPEVFKLINILLVLPVGTATAERSFSDMKLIKNRLRSRLSDINLGRLMRIAIEGPQLSTVDFDQVLDIYKQQHHRIAL